MGVGAVIGDGIGQAGGGGTGIQVPVGAGAVVQVEWVGGIAAGEVGTGGIDVAVQGDDFQENKLLKNILTLCSDLAWFHRRSQETSVFHGKEISLYEAYIERIRTIILNPTRFAQIAATGFKKENIFLNWAISIVSKFHAETEFQASFIPLNDSIKSPEEESVTQSMILETTSDTSFEYGHIAAPAEIAATQPKTHTTLHQTESIVSRTLVEMNQDFWISIVSFEFIECYKIIFWFFLLPIEQDKFWVYR